MMFAGKIIRGCISVRREHYVSIVKTNRMLLVPDIFVTYLKTLCGNGVKILMSEQWFICSRYH